MAIDTLIKTVLSELKVAINSKTVIGEPTTFKNWTVIPVTRVSFGFGAGGGQGKNDAAGFGGGSGGGATIEPVAFIAISEKEVKLISLKEKETIWEKILKPEVGEKIYNKLMGIAETAADASDSTPEEAKKD